MSGSRTAYFFSGLKHVDIWHIFEFTLSAKVTFVGPCDTTVLVVEYMKKKR